MPYSTTHMIAREERPGSLNLFHGRAFTQAPLEEVEDFLKSRCLEKVRADSTTFRLVAAGQGLALEHVNGQVRQWPLRHTFFQKLLRWYNFPRKPVYRMDIDTVVPLLNGILRLIGKEVSVTIEDGEALSIFSPKYRELPDLDVLARCNQPIASVTRNDFFLRVFTETRITADAVPGDPCGFGANIFNSETGFMALEVSAYILRYICSNGAVCPLEYSRQRRLVHYNLTSEEISRYLDDNLRVLDQELPLLVARLQQSVKLPLPEEKDVVSALNGILDFPNGKRMYDQFALWKQDRLYDLFNFVTEQAKRYPAERQLQLQQYAGELICV